MAHWGSFFTSLSGDLVMANPNKGNINELFLDHRVVSEQVISIEVQQVNKNTMSLSKIEL